MPSVAPPTCDAWRDNKIDAVLQEKFDSVTSGVLRLLICLIVVE